MYAYSMIEWLEELQQDYIGLFHPEIAAEVRRDQYVFITKLKSFIEASLKPTGGLYGREFPASRLEKAIGKSKIITKKHFFDKVHSEDVGTVSPGWRPNLNAFEGENLERRLLMAMWTEVGRLETELEGEPVDGMVWLERTRADPEMKELIETFLELHQAKYVLIYGSSLSPTLFGRLIETL